MLPSPSPPFSLSHTDKGGGGIREEKPGGGEKTKMGTGRKDLPF